MARLRSQSFVLTEKARSQVAEGRSSSLLGSTCIDDSKHEARQPRQRGDALRSVRFCKETRAPMRRSCGVSCEEQLYCCWIYSVH